MLHYRLWFHIYFFDYFFKNPFIPFCVSYIFDMAQVVWYKLQSLKYAFFFREGCQKLRYLNISWCRKVSSEGLKAIGNGCPLLSILLLRGCLNVSTLSSTTASRYFPILIWYVQLILFQFIKMALEIHRKNTEVLALFPSSEL